MVRRLFNIIRHTLAVCGLVSVLGVFFLGFQVLKSYHYPPHILAQKALNRVGLGDTPVAAIFAPSPVRPDGLMLPDPADPGWNGIGAQNHRTLAPVFMMKPASLFPEDGWAKPK